MSEMVRGGAFGVLSPPPPPWRSVKYNSGSWVYVESAWGGGGDKLGRKKPTR